MKTILAIALTLVLTTAMLTGCGCSANVGGSVTTAPTTRATTAPTTAATTQPTTQVTRPTNPSTVTTQPDMNGGYPGTEETTGMDDMLGMDTTGATGENGGMAGRGMRRR